MSSNGHAPPLDISHPFTEADIALFHKIVEQANEIPAFSDEKDTEMARNFVDLLQNTPSCLEIIAEKTFSFQKPAVKAESYSSSSLSLEADLMNYKPALREIFPRAGTTRSMLENMNQEHSPQEPLVYLPEPGVVTVPRDFNESIKSIEELHVSKDEEMNTPMQKCILDVQSLIKDFELYEKVKKYEINLLFPGRRSVFLESTNEFLNTMQKYFSKTFNLLRSLNGTCERLNLREEKIQIAGIINELIRNSCVFTKHPKQLFITKQKHEFQIKILVEDTVLRQDAIKLYLISESEAKNIATSNFNGDILTVVPKNQLGIKVFDLESNQIIINHINHTVKFDKIEKKKVDRDRGISKRPATEQKYCMLLILNYTINEHQGNLWKLSVPLTVDVHNKQAGISHARIFWDNIYLKISNIFYDVPSSLEWRDIREALIEEFQAIVGGKIPENNLQCLFNILYAVEEQRMQNIGFVEENPEAYISFKSFAKEEWIIEYKRFHTSRKSYSFFDWFCNVMTLIKEDNALLGLWRENLIAGFISKNKACQMLHGTPPGTFVIRVSETRIGTLTISYRHQSNGQIYHISPLDKDVFKNESLPKIICDTIKLHKLYPNKDKSAFEKHIQEDEIIQERNLSGEKERYRAFGYLHTYQKSWK